MGKRFTIILLAAALLHGAQDVPVSILTNEVDSIVVSNTTDRTLIVWDCVVAPKTTFLLDENSKDSYNTDGINQLLSAVSNSYLVCIETNSISLYVDYVLDLRTIPLENLKSWMLDRTNVVINGTNFIIRN